ncbi:MAG: hypothetical protein HY874_12705 [Chloroflexi bacterium]|nr:hypothetical protein [Chloroflexota bacterium]
MLSPRTIILAFVAFVAFALFAARIVHAQTPADAVSEPIVKLTPAVATVGDRLTLTITVEHREGVVLTPPGYGAAFGGIEVVDIAPPSVEQRDGGRARTTFAYTLAAFTTGEFTVPAQSIAFVTPDGAAGTVTTTPRSVTINSVLDPGDTSLRPLKPQLDIDDGAPSPIAPIAFVGMLAALTAIGYVLQARAVAIAPPAPLAVATPPAPPDGRARAALDAAAPLAGTDVRAYYALIAAAVRAYLSERFDFPAYAMTRTEMERGMAAAGIDRWPARLTANLLEQCDAVQFAGFVPAPERRAADLIAAYEIIDLTSPAETSSSTQNAPAVAP